MTRPAAPARGVREKKRTRPRCTAHIEYQPAGLNSFHRRVKEAYHAITDQAVKVGFITRRPGTALCGAAGPWDDIPDGLFPPQVSCRVCQQIIANAHITIIGGMP